MRNQTARDEGSALILALVFTTAIALILGALLSFASMTQRTTVALRSEAASAYDVDGAVQQAINTLQRGTFINDEGSYCFGASDTSAGVETDTMVIPDPDGTGSIAVVCDGVLGSGVQSPEVPITMTNTPGNAILTLGSAGTDGLNVESTYDSRFSRFDVGGPVFSHGPIKTNGRNLVARGYVRARGDCPDAARITPTPQCNYGGYDGGLDPNLGLPTVVPGTDELPYRKVPTSTCTSILGFRTTITFEPGYYDDAAALNAVTSRDCNFWFKPGTYYFDFHNGDNPALPPSSHEWRVTDGRLIAGTRTTTFPLLGINMDCLSPLKTTAVQKGVRFVFGGNSRLTVSNQASAAICGSWSGTGPTDSGPPIAVQGVKTGSETTQIATLAPTAQTSVASFIRNPTGTTAKVWEGAKEASDSITAQFTKTKNGNNTASGNLEVSSYTSATAIPSGSVIDSLMLDVRHNSPATIAGDTRSVVLTVPGSPNLTCPLAVPNTHPGAFFTDALDVLTDCSTAFVQRLVDTLRTSGQPTSGTKVNYSVTLAKSTSSDRTDVLDALTLKVTFRAPAYRTQQGAAAGDSCNLGATFVPNSSFDGGRPGECAALFLRSGVGSILPGINNTAVNGTVYTPLAAVAVRLDFLSSSGLRSGVISRSLYLRAAGVLTFANVASVPFTSQGTDPSAYLTAYVCETASTCSATTGVPKIKAKVTLVGQDTANRRAAKIPSYSVQQ